MESDIKTNLNINDIARYTLLNLFSKGITVCPLKLQKLLYYIQSWHMVYFNNKLIFEEKPEAWVNGPVYKTVYDVYKNIGLYDQIKPQDVINPFDPKDETKCILDNLIAISSKLSLTKDQIEFLESIYEHYGTMSHDRLVFLTHAEEPWSEAREGLSPFDYSHKKLSLDTMFTYYSERLKRNRVKADSQ